MRILVFDDDLVHRPGFLGALPAELVYRPHADRAVADVREVRPDLVLMDFAMGPHQTGAQAVTRLREVWPPGALYIVGISTDSRCNWQMKMAGADETIAKGGAPDVVRRLLLEDRLADQDDEDDRGVA